MLNKDTWLKGALKDRLKFYINTCCCCFMEDNANNGLFYYGKAKAWYDLLVVETLGECETFEELFESLKGEEYKDIKEAYVKQFLF